MPLYEYICTECEHKQEVMRLVRELNKVQFCDKCGGQMNLIPAVPSRMIRGSGGWSSPA